MTTTISSNLMNESNGEKPNLSNLSDTFHSDDDKGIQINRYHQFTPGFEMGYGDGSIDTMIKGTNKRANPRVNRNTNLVENSQNSIKMISDCDHNTNKGTYNEGGEHGRGGEEEDDNEDDDDGGRVEMNENSFWAKLDKMEIHKKSSKDCLFDVTNTNNLININIDSESNDINLPKWLGKSNFEIDNVYDINQEIILKEKKKIRLKKGILSSEYDLKPFIPLKNNNNCELRLPLKRVLSKEQQKYNGLYSKQLIQDYSLFDKEKEKMKKTFGSGVDSFDLRASSDSYSISTTPCTSPRRKNDRNSLPLPLPYPMSRGINIPIGMGSGSDIGTKLGTKTGTGTGIGRKQIPNLKSLAIKSDPLIMKATILHKSSYSSQAPSLSMPLPFTRQGSQTFRSESTPHPLSTVREIQKKTCSAPASVYRKSRGSRSGSALKIQSCLDDLSFAKNRCDSMHYFSKVYSSAPATISLLINK